MVSHDAQLNGQNVRFSIGIVLLIDFFVIIFLSALVLAFPGFATIIFSFTGSIILAAFGVLSLWMASGWAFFCGFAIPPILWAASAMQFLVNTFVPDCPFIIAGLISNEDYTNSNCMRADLWLANYFNVPNCNRDLGWGNVLDPIIFLLHQWMPSWLTFIQNPSNFPWPLNYLIGSASVQVLLHRWDNVNLADPVAYSQAYTCAIFIEALPMLVIIYTSLALLLFDPVRYVIASGFLLLEWLLTFAAFLLYGLTVRSHVSAQSSVLYQFGFMGAFLSLPIKVLEARSKRF